MPPATPADPGRRLAVARVRWRPSYRVIPSRFPPIQLFERVADLADLESVFAIEALTDDRVRHEVGELALIPAEDRVTGAGASHIMAPFTHVPPFGTRFTDGTFGAYYAARELATAIEETKFHRARFMAYTDEPPMHLDMRIILADLDGRLHDARGSAGGWPEIYDPADYSASQALARKLRSTGSWGIVYDSVRHTAGECAAVFRPPVLSSCRQGRHLTYVWDGTAITDVYEKRVLR